MNQNIKIKIKETLKTSLRNFFKNRKVKTFHVLDYIFPVERRIRSLIGGLETSKFMSGLISLTNSLAM